MTITSEQIREWNSRFERKIMDRKSYRILSHPEDLADLMVAFANNIKSQEEFGGRILIGISNEGVIENLTEDKSRELGISRRMHYYLKNKIRYEDNLKLYLKTKTQLNLVVP